MGGGIEGRREKGGREMNGKWGRDIAFRLSNYRVRIARPKCSPACACRDNAWFEVKELTKGCARQELTNLGLMEHPSVEYDEARVREDDVICAQVRVCLYCGWYVCTCQ